MHKLGCLGEATILHRFFAKQTGVGAAGYALPADMAAVDVDAINARFYANAVR